MSRRHRFLALPVLVVAGCLVLGAPAQAGDDPMPRLQHLVTSLQMALMPGRPAGALESLVRQQLIPLLDVEGIARQVTGPRWSASGAATRSRFKVQIRQRLEHLALSALREHGAKVRAWLAGARLLPPSRPEPGYLLVRLRHPQGSPDEVRLWLAGGHQGWRVVNVSTVGFSLAGMAKALLGPASGAMLR